MGREEFTAKLKLLWLGQPCIFLDEKQVKSEMRRITAILAYLSLHPGEVSRESLVALFWSESDQRHAMGSLRRALWSLSDSHTYESPNSDQATHEIEITAESGAGNVFIETK